MGAGGAWEPPRPLFLQPAHSMTQNMVQSQRQTGQRQNWAQGGGHSIPSAASASQVWTETARRGCGGRMERAQWSWLQL